MSMIRSNLCQCQMPICDLHDKISERIFCRLLFSPFATSYRNSVNVSASILIRKYLPIGARLAYVL
jgi:hypothetical protein